MYNEFSIESALNTKPVATGYKLEGMKNFAAITANPSRSTEEFISGAISCLGKADRAIMYTTLSLEALDDRLKLAAKIAKPVNKAKTRGAEGFSNVSYLNPWEYAIEGKVGDFFKKIWAAICTICVKIIEAIQHFIRFIGNAIASAGAKMQAKDYKYYTDHKSEIEKAATAAKVDDMEMNSLPWAVNAGDISKKFNDFLKAYQEMDKDESATEILTRADNVDLKKLKTKEDITSAIIQIFGSSSESDVKTKLNTVLSNMNGYVQKGKDALSAKNKKYGTGSREFVKAFFLKGDGKVTKQKIGDIKSLAGADFGILSPEWLGTNVKKIVAEVHDEEKKFSKFTAKVQKIAKKFEKSEGLDKSAEGSISSVLAKIAKTKCAVNNFYNYALIDMTTYTLRLRKSCHIALKAYLKVAKKKDDKKEDENSKESLQSIESMFQFDD